VNWPWRRRQRSDHDAEAARVRAEQERKLDETAEKDPEIAEVTNRLQDAYRANSFAQLIDEALGRHR
jgi:hypothetical protein